MALTSAHVVVQRSGGVANRSRDTLAIMGDLASLIREQRQHLGLSQSELAEKIGTSLRTIGNYERGGVIPSRSLVALGQALGVRFEQVDGARWVIRDGGGDEEGATIVRSHESDETDTREGNVLIDFPPGTFDGLDDLQIAEVLTAAKLAGMRVAREVRGH